MNKAVFLDRDGVINLSDNVPKWEEFRFVPGALDGLKLLHENGYKLIITTNQSGVSRGLYRESDLTGIHENMISVLRDHGVEIDAVYYCPHSPEDKCGCRKPESGMLKQAKNDHNIDFSKSFLVGDQTRDIIAGKSVGCKTVLVTSSHTKFSDAFYPDHTVASLREAAKFIVNSD